MLLNAIAVLALLPAHSGRDGQLEVPLPRLEQGIEVDGRLDEPAWEQAARLAGFSAYAPVDGVEAEEATEVLVFYSPTAIHFGVRAAAAAGSVRATLAQRDRLATEDRIEVFLSTFNDARQAQYFAVNPLGVQADGVLVEGAGDSQQGYFGGLSSGREEPDLAPDYVFDSRGRLTAQGYEVEVRIPFKTLRFPGEARQSWRLHVTRNRQWNGHQDSWVPARRAAASFLAQAGTLSGLHDLHRGLVLDLTPEATASVEGRDVDGRFSHDARDPQLGGNLRWGITSDLTLAATVNPDFSQVEADAGELSFDPRSAVFYAEKRPFFLEGIEQFQTPNRLIYTRRVVDPIGALKLTGKLSGTGLAFLTALDTEEASHSGHDRPWFSLLRVQRDLGARSKVALVYTGREDGEDANRVLAADARLGFGELWTVQLQGALGHTRRSGSSRTGPFWEGVVSRNGRRLGLEWQAYGAGDDFQTESGFIGRPRIAVVRLDQRLTFFGPPRSLLESFSTDVVLNGLWRHRDLTAGRGPLERKLHVNNNAVLRGGWKAGVSVLIERFDFDSDLYAGYRLASPDGRALPFAGTPFIRNLDWVVSLNTPRFRGFSAGGFWLFGRDENFFEWSPADIQIVDASLDFRPTERIRLEGRYQLQKYDRRSDGTTAGSRQLPRLKLEYQVTRSVFLRAVGELDLQRQADLRDDTRSELPLLIEDPATGRFELARGFRQKGLRLDLLFSYQPRPGTVLFLGYGSRLEDPEALDQGFRRRSDGFFAKLSYLFRM